MTRFLLVLLLCSSAPAADVLRAHNDASGSSVNTDVFITPASLSAGKFALLGSYTTDGLQFGQNLFVSGVTVSGAVHDLLIVATLANSVYAFDARVPGSAALWHVNFGAGNTAYPGCCSAVGFFYGAAIGTVSTPTVDKAAGLVYVALWSSAGAWTVKRLSIADGSTVDTTTVGGQVAGTGDPSGGDTTSGGNVVFFPAKQLQRPGLTINNGRLYIAFGGVGDNHPWHGWIMAYNTSDMSQAGIFCTTPNSFGGAIWGGEPTFDESGNVYVTTGNGQDYDGLTTFTDSVLKLSPTLTLLDWFTPSNNVAVNAADADVSSNRVILIPGTNYAAVSASKDFNVYVIDTTCMGHLQGSSGCTLQTFKTNASGTVTAFSGSYGGAFMASVLHLPTTAGSLYAFAWGGSSFNTTPIATNLTSYGAFGPSAMSGSCNGSSNCILWVTTTASGLSSFTSTHPGTLRALNPTTLVEYWNSDTSGSDTLGTLAKFVAPTITPRNVYVATQDSKVMVYGLITSSTLDGVATIDGVAKIQ